MNVVRDFVTYMESLGHGVFGTDLYIAGVPLEAPNTCWWVVSAGGTSDQRNKTGERINSYIFEVFYRNTDAEAVYDGLQALVDDINGAGCVELENYTFLNMEALAFPTDQDIDDEERTVGLVQVSLTIHQKYS